MKSKTDLWYYPFYPKSWLATTNVLDLESKGAFEDSFEAYYKKEKNRNKFLNVTQKWEQFEKEYGHLKPDELRKMIVIPKIDKDTKGLISNLKVKSNKDYCIQLMSIPEYQLC